MSLRSATLTSLAMLGFALATTALATEIEFTRHLESIDANARSSSTFTATPGVGQLSISSQASETPLEITLNDERLGLAPAIQLGNNAITVTLLEQNSITVQSSTERSLTIRITQQADVVTHVESRVHFNTNVSNFEQAREFYGALGFKTLTGFPDTNTLAMAHAIGVTTPTEYDGSKGDHAGGYLLHGELIGVGGYKGGLIDLIEFTIPRNDEPPYAKTNHLGMASAVLYSSNIDADYANVRKLGATTLSAPVTRADGIRFFVFTDPDGTFYEVQQSGEVDSSEQSSHLIGLGPVYFNVSDFERSRAWYQMLGFVETAAIPQRENLEVARALGFDQPLQRRGALLTHPADESSIILVQWISPYDAAPPYPLPVNHLGIHRTAYASSDIAADVATLKAQGVEFVSPITPCCSGDDSPGSIVAFYDPDGIIVELVEQPFMTEFMAVLAWIKNLFD